MKFKIVTFIFYLFIFLNNTYDKKQETFYKVKQENVFISIETSVEEDLNENIENQLKDIDFSALDSLMNNLGETERNSLLNNSSFFSLVKKFINGENSNLYNNFFSYTVNIFFENILSFLPYFSIIIAISIIYSLLGNFSSEKNKSVSNVVYIVCFSCIAVVVLKLILQVMSNTSEIICFIEKQMEIIFPIILTLISAIGGVVTASSFQPILAILSVIITKLFTTILIPIFLCSVIFGIVGNISKNVKMEKFSKFFNSLFVWIIGIIFTIFIAFLSIQGLTVSTIDSISLKTAKFAIKSYVPILGSYLSDGVGLILASSVLIKNAIGVTGLILLFSTILLPIIEIIVLILLFKLTSAILETICDERISNFLFSISKSLNMLNVCLLAVGFMYLIAISILMCSSNIL